MKIEDLHETDLDERFIKSLAETLGVDEKAVREHLEIGERIIQNFPDEELLKKREFTHRKLVEGEK